MTHCSEKLRNLGAPKDIVDWARAYDTFPEAWGACDRGDWILWIAGTCSGTPGSESRRYLVLVASQYFHLLLEHLTRVGDCHPVALDTFESYALGKDGVTLDQVCDAAASVRAIAARGVAAHAAPSVANAIYLLASYHRIYAAQAASYVAYYVATVTGEGSRCLEIAREAYPDPPELPYWADPERGGSQAWRSW